MPMNEPPRSARSNVRASVAFLALLACPAILHAGPTDPTLVISSALAAGAPNRIVLVRGIFPGSDLVQNPYPLQCLVHSLVDGTAYVRFAIADQAYTGSDAALADGLDAADVPGLLAAGTVAPDGQVIGLRPDRLDVVLPASFPAGPAEVQFFVLEPGDTVPVLSNPFPVQVPLP